MSTVGCFPGRFFLASLKASGDRVAAPNERAGADTSRTNRGIHMLKCGLIFATSRSKIHTSLPLYYSGQCLVSCRPQLTANKVTYYFVDIENIKT